MGVLNATVSGKLGGKGLGVAFFNRAAPSERYCKIYQRQHKKITDWARQLIMILNRWLPGKKIVIVADSIYSALELLNAVKDKAILITRLQLDAALYEPAPECKAGQVGRKRLKGKRLPTLKEQLISVSVRWKNIIIPQWYGDKDKKMELATAT